MVATNSSPGKNWKIAKELVWAAQAAWRKGQQQKRHLESAKTSHSQKVCRVRVLGRHEF